VPTTHYAQGGKGAIGLARALIEATQQPANFRFLYPLDSGIKEKITIIAREMYGANDVDYSEDADDKIRLYSRQGYGNLPICMAKTHLSLSHDPKLKGRPTGFTLPTFCGRGVHLPYLRHNAHDAGSPIRSRGSPHGH
jgi:formyltetrahydrofolate synthetase